MKKAALIVAGGSGLRMKSNVPKQFLTIHAKPLLLYSIEAFYNAENDIEIIVVLPANQIPRWEHLCLEHKINIRHNTTEGGDTRFHSVKNGLNLLNGDYLVAVHDGVRPLIKPELISKAFLHAHQNGNAVPCISVAESLRVKTGKKYQGLNRNHVKIIQTPQVFHSKLLKKAYQQDYNNQFTDDATVIESLGETIHLIEGDSSNIKITTPLDLKMAEVLMSS